MKEHRTSGNEQDLSGLWNTLEELESGSLPPGACEALDRLLGESAEARAIYLEYFELATMIESAAGVRSEEGRLPVFAGNRKQKKILSFSVLAAAAAIVLMATIAAYISVKQSPHSVSDIAVVQGTEWSIDGERQSPGTSGQAIKPGSTVNVSSGLIAVTLKSGARMVLQGPAHVIFPSMDKPDLTVGWLWFDSGDSGKGIEIHTPELQVRDVGTRFGVRVRQDRFTEIHLIEGMVEAESPTTGTKEVLGPVARAAMVPGVGAARDLPMSRDPFAALEEMLKSRQGYVTTVMSQSPSGYWRLNDAAPGNFANAVAPDHAGEHGPSAQAAAPGVRPADGFAGFGEDNLGVFLPGSDAASTLVNLDVPAGVRSKSGAVSFWFRKEEAPEDFEMLWYAGKRGDGLGEHDEMHAYLDTSGRLAFFMESGKYDILLSSSREVTDGNWHHVAASWGSRKVELFLDGRRVAEDSQFRRISESAFSGLDVRFGKSRANNFRQFHGWVDEIAYWDRPLTFLEVQRQFRSAKEPLSPSAPGPVDPER